MQEYRSMFRIWALSGIIAIYADNVKLEREVNLVISMPMKNSYFIFSNVFSDPL